MKYLKSIHDFLSESKDPYMKGLDDEDKEEKEELMKKQSKMDDDNPDAYKEMPGDKKARKSGNVKTSKHVKKYHELYGESNEPLAEASKVLKFKEHGITDLMDLNNLIKFLMDNDINWNQKSKAIEFDNVKDAQKAIDWLNESMLTESVMSDLHQLADEVKDEDQFVKQFFQKFGSKIKKSKDSVEWVKSLYQDTVNESSKRSPEAIRKQHAELKKLSTKDLRDMWSRSVKIGNPESLDKTGLISDILVFRHGSKHYKAAFESVINEKEKQSTDRSPLEDDSMESGLKKKADETGVPIGIIRAVARRGLAAWRTGHRPGATQQQWAYARVNSFLTKQPGTWGGADSDLAKEVRDGGHDKNLKSS